MYKSNTGAKYHTRIGAAVDDTLRFVIEDLSGESKLCKIIGGTILTVVSPIIILTNYATYNLETLKEDTSAPIQVHREY